MFWNHGGGTRGLYKHPILKEFEFSLLVYLSSITVESCWVIESVWSVCMCMSSVWYVFMVGLWSVYMCMWWSVLTEEEVKFFLWLNSSPNCFPKKKKNQNQNQRWLQPLQRSTGHLFYRARQVLFECLTLLNTLSFVFWFFNWSNSNSLIWVRVRYCLFIFFYCSSFPPWILE